MNILNVCRVAAILLVLAVSSCVPRTYTNGGVYVRNLSKYQITATLRTEQDTSPQCQIEAGEKKVVGVFLKTNETGTLEITDASGKNFSLPVKAKGRSGEDVIVDFP